MNILGLMSGSSCDGLDLALCRFKKKNNSLVFKLLHSSLLVYEEELAHRLRSAPQLSAKGLIKFDREYGAHIGKKVGRYIKEKKLQVDSIGWHGHTVYHYPQEGFTLQIGHSAGLSYFTGLPVISDFRQKDIFAGGQGAPLAPLVEKFVYPGYDAYLNLGGIANMSFQINNHFEAADLGGCNQLLDRAAHLLGLDFDDMGKEAEKGVLLPELLSKLNNHPYCKLSFPKTLDNSQVIREFWTACENFLSKPNDLLFTLVHHIADQVSLTIDNRKNIHTLFVTGGGALNTFLMDIIREKTPAKMKVIIPSFVDVKFKEAILMALMAYRYQNKKYNVMASVTGAIEDTIGGQLHL